MPSLTVENYLKAALQITMRSGGETVSTGELAEEMNVSPGTVTSMLKTLADSDLAAYKPYEGARLTPAGRKLALRMLRRHRLIELFLAQTLNLSWDRVHSEAENMEHAVSDYLVDRIDDFLGHPDCDPHGDPIPAANGELRGRSDTARPLSECHANTSIRLVRVVNQHADFLRYLSEVGLERGAVGEVTENNSEAGLVTVIVNEKSVPMGYHAANQLLVESLPD